MTLNEFFSAHELSRVEIGFSGTRQTFTAIRNSATKLIKDNLFGEGYTPEAALADLMMKVNSARPQPAPIVTKQEPVIDDLDDLLG